jgi:hypothetical protein
MADPAWSISVGDDEYDIWSDDLNVVLTELNGYLGNSWVSWEDAVADESTLRFDVWTSGKRDYIGEGHIIHHLDEWDADDWWYDNARHLEPDERPEVV